METPSAPAEFLPPSPCGDDAVGLSSADHRLWFVAVVNNHSERRVAADLERLGHEVYVPTRRVERELPSGRTSVVDRVLLPAMVLVRCTEAQRREVVKLPQVKRFRVDATRFTPYGGHLLMTIAHDEVEAFRRALAADATLPFDSVPFTPGEAVRISGGQFDGITGTVVRTPNRRHQVLIALGTLGCLRVTIAARHLKKASTK